jgi:MoxR-like ATPase
VAAPRGHGAAFVDVATIRAAALSAGLRLPGAVYANVAAALAAGKHVMLTGPPGAGKTTLAMAVARAAAQAGQALGATVLTGAHPTDVVIAAAQQGRWVIADELDRTDLDEALGGLSTFLAGIPVALASTGEAAPAEGWRIVATAHSTPPASPALTRRFATIEVLAPSTDEMHGALHQAANGDATAARAAERLLGLAELKPLGAGVFLDAARHAAARNLATPADEETLAKEAYRAYVRPLLGELDAQQQQRVQHLLG